MWGFQSDVCSSQLLVPSPLPPPLPRNMEDASNVTTMSFYLSIFKVVVQITECYANLNLIMLFGEGKKIKTEKAGQRAKSRILMDF